MERSEIDNIESQLSQIYNFRFKQQTPDKNTEDDDFLLKPRYQHSKYESREEKPQKFSAHSSQQAKKRKIKKKKPTKIETPASSSHNSFLKRPQSARAASSTPRTYYPSFILQEKKSQKRTDLVHKHQQMQNQWDRCKFLASSKENPLQGRKLKLYEKLREPDFVIVHSKTVHDYKRPSYIAPHEKRRDQLRFMTRVRAI